MASFFRTSIIVTQPTVLRYFSSDWSRKVQNFFQLGFSVIIWSWIFKLIKFSLIIRDIITKIFLFGFLLVISLILIEIAVGFNSLRNKVRVGHHFSIFLYDMNCQNWILIYSRVSLTQIAVLKGVVSETSGLRPDTHPIYKGLTNFLEKFWYKFMLHTQLVL